MADPRPDFTVFAGPARRARRKAIAGKRGAVQDGRRARACPHAHLSARAADGPAQPSGQHAGSRDGRVPGRRDHARPDPHAPSNGFNGPSITAAWLAYVLATNPDVEEKLIAEIDGITGGDPDYDLQYDDLMALTYTTQVIKETMRIYPPMPVTIRRSLKDGMLGRYRDPEGRHHPRRDARRAARPSLLGAGRRQVRSGAVRDGEGRRPAAPRLHPVLDREAAVHGARGHVHDAPRRPVRDLPALPAAARAGRDGGKEHGRDDEAGRGSGHPYAARAPRVAPRPAAVAVAPPARPLPLPPPPPSGESRRRSRRRAPTVTS